MCRFLFVKHVVLIPSIVSSVLVVIWFGPNPPWQMSNRKPSSVSRRGSLVGWNSWACDMAHMERMEEIGLSRSITLAFFRYCAWSHDGDALSGAFEKLWDWLDSWAYTSRPHHGRRPNRSWAGKPWAMRSFFLHDLDPVVVYQAPFSFHPAQ